MHFLLAFVPVRFYIVLVVSVLDKYVTGMYLADATVFIAVAMSLAVFDIRKPVVNGVEVQPNMEFMSGVIRYVALPCLRGSFAYCLITVIPRLSIAPSSLGLRRQRHSSSQRTREAEHYSLSLQKQRGSRVA